MSPVLVLHPQRGRDLETDLRAAFDTQLVTSVFVPLGQKLFEAERQWRIDADMETGAGTWALDGYDVLLFELTGAPKRVALRMFGVNSGRRIDLRESMHRDCPPTNTDQTPI